ncbi:MAG: hypothetical protein ACE5PM_08240 [Candidatus Hydrothermarchaeales archaeon]
MICDNRGKAEGHTALYRSPHEGALKAVCDCEANPSAEHGFVGNPSSRVPHESSWPEAKL